MNDGGFLGVIIEMSFLLDQHNNEAANPILTIAQLVISKLNIELSNTVQTSTLLTRTPTFKPKIKEVEQGDGVDCPTCERVPLLTHDGGARNRFHRLKDDDVLATSVEYLLLSTT